MYACDSIGSRGNDPEFFERLAEAGVQIREFNPPNPVEDRNPFDIPTRDHRKLARFLSEARPATRYLADASYWIYLMHMATIQFFITLLRPYDWHWSIKLAIMIGGSMLILLVSYHYLVRFTWIGAILNGRRHPRPQKAPPASPEPARGRTTSSTSPEDRL
jgi:hypothetical protein